ncbi:MAG: hypothetical protein AAGA96_00440 [Verrucomicrobiota bacterium]
MADLAKMVLKGRERYQVRFRSENSGPDLFFCESDGSLWLTRDEAIAHLLGDGRVEKFYTVETVEVAAPSGNFSVVAVCGMSGVILGPPNHHEYQKNVVRLHADRFGHLPLEQFKSRVVMDNSEETIEKWKEQVSQTKHYRPGVVEQAAETEEELAEAEAESEKAEVNEAKEPGDSGEQKVGASSEEAVGASPEESSEDVVEETAEESSEEALEETVEASGEEEEATAKDEGTQEAGSASRASGGDEIDSASEQEQEQVVLTSADDLVKHFKEHFAEDVIQTVREAVVAGNIPGSNLSRGLLELLKQESENQKRGFPLAMIQALCRAFEKEGLRFFKRGKKALHVSMVRPKPISESVSLTPQVQRIVDHLLQHPRTQVIDLLDALSDDFLKPDSKEGDSAEVKLTEGARKVLTDLKWLTSEGFVIEFADTTLELAKARAKEDKKPVSRKSTSKSSKSAKTKAPAKSDEESETPAEEVNETPKATPSTEKFEPAISEEAPGGELEVPEVSENVVEPEEKPEEKLPEAGA